MKPDGKTNAQRDKRLSLDEAVTVPLLKSVWRKSLRKQLRVIRLPDADLAKDPLERLPFEWELDSRLEPFRQDVIAGRYRASAPEVIRAAKGSGLTRPLAFLGLFDQLLYKVIVSRAQATLLRNSPPWTRLGRFNPTAEDNPPGESGWFRNFILRQGQIWRITQNHRWVVETDVANFFPYVHLPSVSAHLHADSNLSADAVRLVEHMLSQFSPLTEYRNTPTVGLPQEAFECSRVIAHTYLRVVDDEFAAEGEADRYSRYMDDIVVGAKTYEQALQHVRRVQMSLERVGLYPNTAKTRIVRRDDFTWEYMKDENDYLGELDNRLVEEKGVDLEEFRNRLKAFLRLRPRPPRAWTRVLRRYYTLSRRLESDVLLRHAHEHIVSFPDSARWILEYLGIFRLTARRFDNLLGALGRLAGVYEDVDLLAHEYLCTAPQTRSPALHQRLADWALSLYMDYVKTRPRLAAAACVTVGKFGGTAQFDALDASLDGALRADNPAGRQAAVLLFGADRLTIDQFPALAPSSGPQTLSDLAFLSAIGQGEAKAIGMALNVMRPSPRRDPDRNVIRPRMMFLAPAIARGDPGRRRQIDYYRDLMLRNKARLRDVAAEDWLAR
jgi:hypothetical protein